MPKENAVKIGGVDERERESKRLRRFVTTFFLVLSLLLQNFLFLVNPVYAALSPWTQTDWVGGSGQTSWSDATKFSSSSNVTTSTANQATLTNSEKLTNTGFETDLTGWSLFSATGGTTTNSAGYTIHTFTTSGTFTPSTAGNVEVLVVAGGGSGGHIPVTGNCYSGGGGGAGGYQYNASNAVTVQSYTVTVGLGGTGSTSTRNDGQNSAFDTITANGGGAGAMGSCNPSYPASNGNNGGSGGGSSNNGTVGIGSQGHNGGKGSTPYGASGSGGGAGVAGAADTSSSGVKGGDGIANSISGSSVTYAGGGGSGGYAGAAGGSGGAGGGGAGGTAGNGSSGIDNTGGGGGGAGHNNALHAGGNGGSGIIIIRYPSLTATRDTSIKYSGAASVKLVNGASAQNFFQLVNVGDTNTYNLSAYAYTDGSAVSSSDVSLYYNGLTVSTTYTSVGSGWYQLTGTITGVASSISSGVQVASGKTVYLDNFSLNNYTSSGTLTSSIFDSGQGSNWGTLTYAATTPTNTSVSVKVRTGNQSNLSDATAFTSCTAISSGSTVGGTTCATDNQRYVQYQLSLANTDSVSTPTFTSFSLAFTVSDNTPPSISLTALSPDPNNDNTPSLTGTATDTGGTVSNVQYQMDGTSGTWTACTADDGSFNSATEAFTCNVSPALSDGSHTIYVRATDSNGNTISDVNASTDTFTIDVTAPTISVTALTPDPTSDNTPSITGTATDATTALTAIEYQVDSTSGSWTSCTASDGSFNAATETFSCTTSALSDGSHTIYVRAVDNASNNSSNASDSFTVDTTNPASFDLDSPGNESYTNSERPSFKWKATSDATAGLSKYVLEIDNPSIGSSQPSGDFTIDNIPTSGTTDITINNKYVIHFDGFSDSDSTNNYISVYTRSTNDWGSSENDGKLREGKVSWKVKAVDNAGNETSSSRTLFVDRSNPKVELTQINDVPFSSTNFSTTDKTPTIFGKITDSLSGGDSSHTQDENGPKIASGPKQVEIKIEKKEGLTYKLHTLYTINMDKPWYTCDGKEVSDNSKQKCDKYLPFEYTPKDSLDLGTYKITLTGKDKADNSSSETSFTLNITTLSRIITPEEKETIEEEIKELPKEEQEKVKEELEITKPVEPSALEKAGDQISQASKNILNTTGNIISGIFNGIGNGVRFTVDITGKALAFVGDKTGQALAFVGKTTSNTLAALYNGTQSILAYVGQGIGNGAKTVGQGLAFAGEKIGQGISTAAQGTQNVLASIGQGIGNAGKAIGDGYNQLANNAPGVAKTILTGIGNGVSATVSTLASATNAVISTTATIASNTASAIGNATNTVVTTTTILAQNTASAIGNTVSSLVKTTGMIAQNTGKVISITTNAVVTTTTTVARNTGSTIASVAQNGISNTKKGIANLAFTVGEKTDDVSHGVGTAIIKIGYLFVPEPTKISNVNAIALSPTSVKVTWETNHPANGKVNFGYEDGIYEFEQQTDKRTSKHEFVLENLKPDTEYHYEVMSQNRNYVYDANRKFKTPAK